MLRQRRFADIFRGPLQTDQSGICFARRSRERHVAIDKLIDYIVFLTKQEFQLSVLN